MSAQYGPNVQRLIAERMAYDVLPDTATPEQAIAFLTAVVTGQRLVNATSVVLDLIAQVKARPDNPWGSDDERIAAGILRQLETQR